MATGTGLFGYGSYYDSVNISDMARNGCYNSSHCTPPQRCIVESAYRRYCGDSRFVPLPGRTLFDLTGEREPGVYGCVRCGSPLSLSDFGLLSDFGAWQCASVCTLPNNSSEPDKVVESYQTSHCRTECAFAQGAVYGDARFATSPYFEGDEPAGELNRTRSAAIAAEEAAIEAQQAADDLALVAAARDRGARQRAAEQFRLEAIRVQAQAALDTAEYLLARARDAAAIASPKDVRSTESAVIEAETNVEAATAELDAALATLEAHAASAPFMPSMEATAPHAEAVVAANAAEAAREAAAAASVAADVGGLRVVPLSEEMTHLWGRDTVWGGAVTARPAGHLLQLTSSSASAQRRRSSVGWAHVMPGRPLHAFRCEIDLLVAGGDGGDGFALSYAPPSDGLIEASVLESRRGDDEGFSLVEVGVTNSGAFTQARSPDEGASSANATPAAAMLPPASASLGLGASVDRGPLRARTPGIGLSISLATRPVHAAMVWFNGTRLAYAPYEGCPPPQTATFGGSCMPCPVCTGCPPCEPCASQQECPLRPGRFARLVVQLRGPNSERPHTVQVLHNGIDLFPQPVHVPGFFSNESWQVFLSAATSAEFDDNHWVDNLRLASAPAQPVPPALVNATATSLAVAWFPPHHGGEPISLYRLQRRDGSVWRTIYIGPGVTRVVRQLLPATTYLLRVQAFNALGWSVGSHAASYTTAMPPLKTDVKPPHLPRVAAGLVRCGGRLYSVGGQHAKKPAGLTGAGRRFLTTFEQYDTVTRTWLRRADMNVSRSHAGLACVRERTLLVVGGYGALGKAPWTYNGPLVSSEEYDPATDTWFPRADAPSARYHFATASEPNGHVFVAGGFGTSLGLSKEAYGTEGVLDAFERYDPYSGVWVRKEPMPFAAYGLGLAVFDCARRCLVIAAGGHLAAGGFTDDAAIYDPRAGEWRLVAPMPARRYGLTLLAQHDEPHAYATGGYELRLTTPFVAEAAAAERTGAAANASTSDDPSSNEGSGPDDPAGPPSNPWTPPPPPPPPPGAGAAAAAVDTHLPSLLSVFQYSVDADSWWVVPSVRQWELVEAFDWRHRQTIAARTSAVADQIVYGANDPERVRDEWNVTQRPWSARNLYVGVHEFMRPEPDRCQHGRNHLGCLTGVGVQRDDFGNEIGLENRTMPPRVMYPLAWEPPLGLDPEACTDCINLAPATETVDANGTRTVVYEAGEPPQMHDDPDEYALVSDINSTYSLRYSEYIDMPEVQEAEANARANRLAAARAASEEESRMGYRRSG